MKKILKILLVVFLLSILYMYILVVQNIPNRIILFEGEKFKINTLLGMKIKAQKNETIETSANNQKRLEKSNKNSEIGKKSIEVSLFENIPLKKVEVYVLPKIKVIPVGDVAGVKLYTNGVLVVGMSEIEGKDNKRYKPYENTGIKEGDRIIKINNKQINTTNDLIETINYSKGNNIEIKYIHETETKECSMTPVKIKDNEYKIGLWVRDSAAGLGTVSFYEPENKMFGALGHGITDIDTNELINIASGEFVTTRILKITKGEIGIPGKIQGTIENQKNIGKIFKNTKFGVYGEVDNISSLNLNKYTEMEVALREEIKEGPATILCSLDNKKPEEYKIEIEKIYKENNYNNKSMKIKVTDQRLLEKTGGIIQGMSGSPIIQNGKFAGAVTCVLIKNPQEGYGVFGDIMIKQLKSRK